MPITLDGVALQNATAPLLFQECKFPIADVRRYENPDEVVENMPTFLGSWARGTNAPAIKSQIINIDTATNSGNACRFPVVTVALGGCKWIAPDQKLMGLESEQINWSELVTDYCTNANISLDRLGEIFNADGTLNSGNPYTLNIVRFVLETLTEALGLTFTHSAMLGDYSLKNQFDGLYPQIDYGWEDTASACDPTLNVGNVVDWNALTNGSGVASPSAVTIATTVTLWGQSFDVPAGWTLGDFLAMYTQAARANYGRGKEINWEMHTPTGWRMGILKSLSCITMCNASSLLTDALRSRYERLIGGQVAELFGYGINFPLFETNYAATNTLRYGPREVGGVPTYGLVFKNIVEVLRLLNPMGAALYGSGAGRPTNEREPLLGMTRQKIANRFESLSLHWDFLKSSAMCITASLMAEAGLLATDRHLWLKITNIGTPTFNLPKVNDFTIDGVAVNNQVPTAPSLTGPANNSSSNDTTPTLTWGVVTGAINYDVEISTDAGMVTVVNETTVGVATYTPAAMPLDEYWWRVRARDVDGVSAWSAIRKFTITS